MKHEEYQVLVSAYHDGEVTAEERILVEAHVAGCAECAETLAAYGRLGRTVHRLPRGEPSRELWSRVQGGLSSRRRWALGWRLLPAAPVLAMLAIAITLIVALGPQFSMAPAAQREVAVDQDAQPLAVEPLASPMAAPAPGGTVAEVAEEYGLAMAPPSPGGSASLEVVSQTVRRGGAYAAPRLVGVLYDAAGQPLAGAGLVVSDLVGWTGLVTTTAGGAFALDLPARGTYYVALAGSPDAEKALGRDDGAANAAISGTVGVTQTNAMPGPVVLEVDDEVVVALRVR